MIVSMCKMQEKRSFPLFLKNIDDGQVIETCIKL